MTRRVLIQSADEKYRPLLELSHSNHLDYCMRHGIVFSSTIGLLEPRLTAHWNKIQLILAMLGRGFERVAWLDADTVIVDHAEDLFAALPDDKVIAMAQYDNVMWRGEPHFNSGVMVVRNCWAARRMFRWVWSHRTRQHAEYRDGFYEQNQILEYVSRRRRIVATLPPRFNHIEGLAAPGPVVIRGYHGTAGGCLDEMRRDLPRGR